MPTLYVTHKLYAEHHMQGYDHPERPERIEAVWQAFRHAALLDRLDVMDAPSATDEMLLRVHDQHHLDTLEAISKQDRLVMYDADTYARPASPQIARLAAGGVVAAIEAVIDGTAQNALAAVRPPGHHATPTKAMGFCLLSNIAIGARHAQARGHERVLIVDYDVHHGNGTQDAFYDDDSVLFISSHQYPFYPGSGALGDTGRGSGVGATVNIPLRAGFSDTGYQRIFTDIIWKAARRFQPDIILVSAGFDAHYVDRLAGMRLSLVGYAHITRELKGMADDLCGGKIVFVMEGGYDLRALSHGMRNIAHVLLDEDEISDPYGLNTAKEPEIAPIIEQVQAVHNL